MEILSNQLLPDLSASKFILTTRESDQLWNMNGKQQQLRPRNDSPKICKWLQHPRSTQYVMHINGAAVHIYTWEDWLEVKSIPTAIDMAGLQLKSVTPSVVNHRSSILVELSELHGGADTRGLGLLDVESLDVELRVGESVVPSGSGGHKHTANSTAINRPGQKTATSLTNAQLRTFSTLVSHIIDTFDVNKLILSRQAFLGVLSRPGRSGRQTCPIFGHFFMPYDWFSGNRGIVCTISGRNILFARNNNIAIIEGDLDNAETVIVTLRDATAIENW